MQIIHARAIMERTCLLFCLIRTLFKHIINDEYVQKKDDAVMTMVIMTSLKLKLFWMTTLMMLNLFRIVETEVSGTGTDTLLTLTTCMIFISDQ